VKSFEIFEGTAREDDLIASLIFFQEDYGKDIEDYKDYLLSRENFLLNLSMRQPVRVIDVPYNKQMFEEWLGQNPYWRNNLQEAKGAWALDAAKDDKKLLNLHAKYPVLPYPPRNEEILTDTLYATMSMVVGKKEDVLIYSKKLPYDKLTKIQLILKKYFHQVPAFKQLSLLRCRGACFAVGDRLILPFSMEKASSCLETKLSADVSDGIISVPRSMRIRVSDIDICDNLFITIVLLPIIFKGAASEIIYCKNVLRARSDQGFENIDELDIELNDLSSTLQGVRIEGKTVIVDAYEVIEMLNEMNDDEFCENNFDDYDYEAENPKTIKSKGNLKRIK